MKNYNVYRLAVITKLRSLGLRISDNPAPSKLAMHICMIRKVSVVGKIRNGLGRRMVKEYALEDCSCTPVLRAREKTKIEKSAFFESPAWRVLRYRVLVEHGGRCQCCGRSAVDGVAIHVDHIKPRSKFPELALEQTNLQVLCEDCNLGKSNKDDTDWRPKLVVNNGG